MHDSERYRRNAADCLLAAQNAREPHYRRLYLSMAQSWLSLAYHGDAMHDLMSSWATTEPVKADGIVQFPMPSEPLADRSRKRANAG